MYKKQPYPHLHSVDWSILTVVHDGRRDAFSSEALRPGILHIQI